MSEGQPKEDIERIDNWVEGIERSVRMMAAYLRQDPGFENFVNHNLDNWQQTTDDNESMSDQDKLDAKAQHDLIRQLLVGP